MIRFTAKEIEIEIDEPEDVVLLLKECISKLTSAESDQAEDKRPSSNAERCKRYRDNKKHVAAMSEPCHDHVESMSQACQSMSKHVTDTKEERDEKEEVLPFFPSSLSSSPSDSPNNNPITPISPLPEEKAEREENIYAVGAKDRGPLLPFGEFVRLSEAEYQRLCRDYGKQKADQMIRGMNSYIGADETGKLARKYQTRNHNLTLRNWENKDQKEKETKQQKQIPKEKSFRDLRIEMESREQDDIIESFWRV